MFDPLADLLGQPYKKSFGPADVAEPIRVLVLDHFAADELRAVLTEPAERLVDVVHGEHDAEVTERVHRGVPVIGDRWRRQKLRELEPAVAVRRAHHGDLDALVAQSGDAPCPLPFDRASPLELQAEFREKSDSGIEGFHDDADVVHPLERHLASSGPVASTRPRTSVPADGRGVGSMTRCSFVSRWASAP